MVLMSIDQKGAETEGKKIQNAKNINRKKRTSGVSLTQRNKKKTPVREGEHERQGKPKGTLKEIKDILEKGKKTQTRPEKPGEAPAKKKERLEPIIPTGLNNA